MIYQEMLDNDPLFSEMVDDCLYENLYGVRAGFGFQFKAKGKAREFIESQGNSRFLEYEKALPRRSTQERIRSQLGCIDTVMKWYNWTTSLEKHKPKCIRLKGVVLYCHPVYATYVSTRPYRPIEEIIPGLDYCVGDLQLRCITPEQYFRARLDTDLDQSMPTRFFSVEVEDKTYYGKLNAFYCQHFIE